MPGETEPLGNTFVDEAPPAFPPDASANEVICRLIHEILACLPSQDDNPFGEVLSKLREILATHTDVESDLGRLFDQWGANLPNLGDQLGGATNTPIYNGAANYAGNELGQPVWTSAPTGEPCGNSLATDNHFWQLVNTVINAAQADRPASDDLPDRVGNAFYDGSTNDAAADFHPTGVANSHDWLA